METTLEYKGYTIEIERDPDPSNPIEEWDGNVNFCLHHSRYCLQNDTDLNTDDYTSWTELKKALVKKHKALAILPVFMYDHSGQTISTTPFQCRWDSGQLGYAFINKEVLKVWGYKSRKGYEKATKQTLEDAIISNVSLYNNYISGEVYGFRILDLEGEHLDSCWGYYGEDSVKDAIEEAESCINWEVKKTLKTTLNKLKCLIKYRVPLELREAILNNLK